MFLGTAVKKSADTKHFWWPSTWWVSIFLLQCLLCFNKHKKSKQIWEIHKHYTVKSLTQHVFTQFSSISHQRHSQVGSVQRISHVLLPSIIVYICVQSKHYLCTACLIMRSIYPEQCSLQVVDIFANFLKSSSRKQQNFQFPFACE